ncbi:hypothetical protein [Flavobacterium sp. J27]|uniref:hypothetical protein n=1 Tax=Flavobacterium sp. J27 TaxID=2060419 RepID=UPI0010307560|nr:hypothetical protein [Flavobacterium sp. J27]
MKNLYNKGPYRGYERAKHLRPYWKKIANRKWRATEEVVVEEAIALEQNDANAIRNPVIKKKPKKSIKVKIKFKEHNDKISSVYTSYRSYKQLNDAIKRNNVITVLFKTNKKTPSGRHYQYE